MKLVDIVQKYPDLPIFAWVSSEVVPDDMFVSWLGQFGDIQIKEYTRVEAFGSYDCTWVFKDDTEDYFEWLVHQDDYDDLSEEEATKKANHIIDSLSYQKAIFVEVNVPDSI